MWKYAVDHAFACFLGLICAAIMYWTSSHFHWPLPWLLGFMSYIWGHIVFFYILSDSPDEFGDTPCFDDEDDWEGA